MIEANKYIFHQLASFVEKNNTGTPIDISQKRCIQTDDFEKEWLKKLKVKETQPILPNFKTASFEFDNKEYFVVVGWESEPETINENIAEAIQLIELNAGIVTALLFELKILVRKKSDAYAIINNIFYPPLEEIIEEIIKVDFRIVVDFFEPIFVYEISIDSPFFNIDQQKILKLSGLYISVNKENSFLNFSEQTSLMFERIFLEGSTTIPYDNIVFSLVAVYWKYCFLDIYRCIERLYPIVILKTLHQNLGIKTSLLEFASNIEQYIGWRPRENEAINQLMDELPEDIVKLFQEIKQFLEQTTEGKLGDFIYKIRNSIVHFRPATQAIELDEENWDKLIRASLLAIEYWYDKYEKDLQ
ncbi:hypothetical protein [Gloeothece citriformis]|nr:hypothetical protein [Gloeothece citriformis]